MEETARLTLTKGDISNNTFTIEHPSFHLVKGGWYRITGPSGVGKTTLIRAILGLMECGVERLSNCPKGMGYVPQDFRSALFPWMNGLENLSIFGGVSEEYILRKAGFVGLNESMLQRKVFKMSGGQCQRISILRELFLSPDLLILDEPFSNLDHETSSLVSDLMISHLPKNTCVVISSHQEIPEVVKRKSIVFELKAINKSRSKLMSTN